MPGLYGHSYSDEHVTVFTLRSLFNNLVSVAFRENATGTEFIVEFDEEGNPISERGDYTLAEKYGEIAIQLLSM